MTYSVRLSPHAARDYKKLDPSIQAQIRAGIDELRLHPVSGPKIKRLKGRLREYYRYRVGNYRIVYVVVPDDRTVCIDYLQHRKDVYRSG